MSVVSKHSVTTKKTAAASQGRRKVAAQFVCPIPGCGSTFTRSFNLKGHLRSHTDERPFKCETCGKAFARQHDCKRHMALHVGYRPHTCLGCQRKFARLDALARHRESSFSSCRPEFDAFLETRETRKRDETDASHFLPRPLPSSFLLPFTYSQVRSRPRVYSKWASTSCG
ncbi:hypothetical protein BDY24DRAFT_343286 [Mrakia frigida]|uniref:uncharacterized protein n=1 Tax=Mrakia frigida TaxID=29902 RepID=UPI003FCC0E09